MKKIKYILITILLVSIFSCNEKSWLQEEPLDFYAPANSFTTPEGFNSAVAKLYELVGYAFYEKVNEMWAFHFPTDELYMAINMSHLNPYKDAVVPENTDYIQPMWDRLYQIIFDTNVIIGRIDDPKVSFTNEKQRNSLKAEAMFMRAFAYRILGIAWGGVPLVTEEITVPKRDFVRASRDEIWTQCISDLQFAAINLPEVTELKEDGRLTKAAANHLLAELYIITKDWDKAISAASLVINNPNYALMTQRFGTRKTEPGDVYGDLFKRDNQNRNGKGGLNTEAIWVKQYEYLVTGGGASIQGPRYFMPQMWSLKGIGDNKNLFIGPTAKYGGRGIGWLAANNYLLNQVWTSDFNNDIRNSGYNVIRDIVADNPASKWYGKKIVESHAFDPATNLNNRMWTAIWAKMAPLNNFPPECILDPATGLVNSSANQIFTDNYIFRLAETYLLRAEAYIGKGDKNSAANDINVVRNRAKATPVSPAQVDIDYILDERARELNFEELRVLTLMRTNKFIERVRKYNFMSFDQMLDHNNLWPIPASAIERNSEAILEQNPGYN